MLSLHTLKVYQKALVVGAGAPEVSAAWGKRHVIVEHFRRAAESIVLNIAEAARLRSGPDKARVGLEFVGWFVALPGGRDLSDRLCEEIDKSATSVVLKVAEGNGRYSVLDRRHFWDIASASAVKAAASMDLDHQKAVPTHWETRDGQELLGRTLAMPSGF